MQGRHARRVVEAIYHYGPVWGKCAWSRKCTVGRCCCCSHSLPNKLDLGISNVHIITFSYFVIVAHVATDILIQEPLLTFGVCLAFLSCAEVNA